MKKLISVSVILAAVFAASTAWSYTQIFCQDPKWGPSGYCRHVYLQEAGNSKYSSYGDYWIMGQSNAKVGPSYPSQNGQWTAKYSRSRLCDENTQQFIDSVGGGGSPCAKGQKPSFR